MILRKVDIEENNGITMDVMDNGWKEKSFHTLHLEYFYLYCHMRMDTT